MIGTTLLIEKTGRIESKEGKKAEALGVNFDLASGIMFTMWSFSGLVTVLTT